MDVYSELVESLEDCVAACNNCAASCLNEDDVQMMTECIKLDLDCADTCNLTLKLLARDSHHKMSIVEICKEICNECAAECQKHNHEHCKQCATACERCAEKCGNYLEYRTREVAVS